MGFERNIIAEGECHLWKGSVVRGMPIYNDRSVRRLVLEAAGEIIRQQVYTSCGNARCVRREHLVQRWHSGRLKRCVNKRRVPSERFWLHVDRVEDAATCWFWHGALEKKGYGRFFFGPECDFVLAHRAAWELTNGPIPDGLCVLHRCDEPSCCNPSHLFLGTYSDNNADRNAKERQSRGEQLPFSKLTTEQVRTIRRSNLNGNQLAKLYGVKRNTIYAVLRGETWKNVT